MNETKHDHGQHGGPNSDNTHHDHGPYWKRAHHDWRFWAAASLIFAAMIIYVLSVEFVLRPGNQLPSPPISSTVGK
jgi:hypothetical protein